MITASITFKDGEQPQEFAFHHTGEGMRWVWPNTDNPVFKGKTWRFLADDVAIELVPLCDSLAHQAELPPLFDRLEIWPVRWAYPDSLVTGHPTEVEQMRQDHFAGKHELIDGNYLWPYWLEHYGKGVLWMEFRTADMERHWLSWITSPGCALTTFAGNNGFIRREVLECIRFCANFHNGENCATLWLAECAKSLLSVEERKVMPGYVAEQEQLLRKQADVEAFVPKLAAERQRFEVIPGQLKVESQRIEAATDQLTAKTKALDGVISPLNRLYSDVELAEIRKRADGKGVPDLFADWALMQFQRSSPERLPTKGDAFNHCGPGTVIGKNLEQAGVGISKQRFADHLTVLRRLLEEKGWLARRTSGKSRKRESHFQPDDRFEDFNQPSPAESAEDRDEERQASGLDIGDTKVKEAGGDSAKQSDAD